MILSQNGDQTYQTLDVDEEASASRTERRSDNSEFQQVGLPLMAK